MQLFHIFFMDVPCITQIITLMYSFYSFQIKMNSPIYPF
jgi:hypothetical protein